MSDRTDDQELERRLRVWLHADDASGATAPTTLRDRIDAIQVTTQDHGWAWRRLQSFGAIPVVAATVVIAAALNAVGLGLVQPEFLGSPTDETVTMEELETAVDSAVEALIEAPGVEGYQVAYIGEYLSVSVWFDSRSNGDVVVVQRVDVDVSQTGWWLNPAQRPPGTGRNVGMAVRVLVGDRFYEAISSGSTGGGSGADWSVTDRDEAPRGPLAMGLALLSGDGRMFGLPATDGEVTRERAPDGGSVWTMTVPVRDGESIQRWHIRPTGELAAWSSELVGVTEQAELESDPTT